MVLVNFMIDLPWLCHECPSLASAPRLTVLFGDGGDASKKVAQARAQKGLSTHLHEPPLPLQWGTHHSKIALLIYQDCLRVCIRTFNDVFPDVHQKCNAMYLQDFPIKDSIQTVDEFGCDFQRQLCLYFAKCGGFDAKCLDLYDFSAAAAAIVSSVPGYHTRQELNEFGQLRFRQLLARHCRVAESTNEGIICQASSFGNLPKKWLDEFHTTLATRSDKRASKPPLHLVAPTVSQVRDSLEGWVSSVALFVNKAAVAAYPSLWRRWGPEAPRGRAKLRAEAMPHVKSYCRFAGTELQWLYIGSHNLSKSAWGEIQKGHTQLCIRSYEMGVLFFPERLASLEPDSKQGYFLQKRRDFSGHPKAVLVSSDSECGGPCGDPSMLRVRIPFPTAVPPAAAPSPADPIWSRDWPTEVYQGLDRFGTRFGERGAEFYGYRALIRPQRDKLVAGWKTHSCTFVKGQADFTEPCVSLKPRTRPALSPRTQLAA